MPPKRTQAEQLPPAAHAAAKDVIHSVWPCAPDVWTHATSIRTPLSPRLYRNVDAGDVSSDRAGPYDVCADVVSETVLRSSFQAMIERDNPKTQCVWLV